MLDRLATRRLTCANLLGLGAGALLGRPAIARPAGIVADDAKLVRVYGGGKWCEGPAWDRAASALVFSDVRANRLMRLAGSGDATPIRDPSSNANGNAFAQGRLVSCEQLGRRIVRQEADGGITVLADRFGGKRLNSPNDLAISRDGAIWFTDPTFGLTQPEEGRMAEPEQPGRFVFRLDPDGRLDRVADGLEQPNGIVFSPDERTLYVSDASGGPGKEGRHEIRAFDVDGGRLARERVFARVESGVVDGLAMDTAGRLLGATDRGATIWAPDGAVLGTIPTPVTCANLTFAGAVLFLCCGTSIYRIDTATQGA